MNGELFNTYTDEVCKRFGVTKKELIEKSQNHEVVDARYMLYLLCSRSGMRISYIERSMKGIGHGITHSTIIRGIEKAKRIMIEDEGYTKIVTNIEKDAVRFK